MKRISVFIREGREREGLRMALGFTVMGEEVGVYLEGALPAPDESAIQSIDGLSNMGVTVYSLSEASPFPSINISELSSAALGADHFINF